MATNTADDYVGRHIDNQSENIPASAAPSVNAGKKSIKDYLLEGLMIFVAVSMGFIAENIRENISERRLENEFLISLRVDLKADQSFFEQQIQLIDQRNLIADSLMLLLNAPPPIKNTADFYYWSRLLQRQ